jgi:hypothetical protein
MDRRGINGLPWRSAQKNRKGQQAARESFSPTGMRIVDAVDRVVRCMLTVAYLGVAAWLEKDPLRRIADLRARSVLIAPRYQLLLIALVGMVGGQFFGSDGSDFVPNLRRASDLLLSNESALLLFARAAPIYVAALALSVVFGWALSRLVPGVAGHDARQLGVAFIAVDVLALAAGPQRGSSHFGFAEVPYLASAYIWSVPVLVIALSQAVASGKCVRAIDRQWRRSASARRGERLLRWGFAFVVGACCLPGMFAADLAARAVWRKVGPFNEMVNGEHAGLCWTGRLGGSPTLHCTLAGYVSPPPRSMIWDPRVNGVLVELPGSALVFETEAFRRVGYWHISREASQSGMPLPGPWWTVSVNGKSAGVAVESEGAIVVDIEFDAGACGMLSQYLESVPDGADHYLHLSVGVGVLAQRPASPLLGERERVQKLLSPTAETLGRWDVQVSPLLDFVRQCERRVPHQAQAATRRQP